MVKLFTKSLICLILGLFCIEQLSATVSPVDSLWQEYSYLESDSLKIETLVQISFYQFHNADSVNISLQKADSINQQLQSPLLFGKICESYGIMYGWYLDDFGLAKVCFEESIDHFKEDGSSQNLGYALDGLASMLSEEGAINQAFPVYFEAEEQFREAKDTSGLIMNLCNLGLLSLETGKESSALDYFFQSLALSDINNDPYVKAQILGGIGTAYASQNKSTQSLDYLNKALTLFREQSEPYYVSSTLSEMGELYASMDSLEQSKAAFNESVKIAEAVGSPTLLADIYTGMTEASIHLGHYDASYNLIEKSLLNLEGIEAPNYLFEALIAYGNLEYVNKNFRQALGKIQGALSSINEKNYSQLVIAHRQLSLIHERLSNSQSSFYHLKLAQQYQDSLDNIEDLERMRFAEHNYENYRHELDNQRLLNQKKKQEDLIKEQQTNNRFLIFGMLMAAAFLFVSLLAFWKTRKAAQLAEHTARVKSSFLANMSHEIRTPMNGVLGMTELIESTDLDPEQKDYVSTIKQSSESLLGIINDILDFSKIESGHMEVEHEPIFLRSLIEDTLTLFAAQSTASGVELLYYINPSLPFGFQGDELRIKQILSNLISNALKFTKDGYVSVRVFPINKPNEQGRFQIGFSIEDTGIGIAPEKQEGLFDAFTQADSSTTRKYGGTGLGLTISKRLTRLMGGDISLKSELDKGSTFTFTLETESCPPPVDMSKMIKLPEGKLVYVISDLKIRQEMLTDWFSFRKIDTKVFTSLEQVLDFDLPDVIIVDNRVRSESGWKEFNTWKKHCPVVFLVNSGIELPANIASKTSIALHKPVKCHMMGLAMKKSMELNQEAEVQETNEKRDKLDYRFAQHYPLNILVAEDNLVNQKLIIRILEKLGYQAQMVSNGQDAVSAVHKSNFDIVLMDIHMPIMDGLAATQELLKTMPKTIMPRIVALTANAMDGDREKYVQGGMDAYLSKPFKQEAIIKILKDTALAGKAV